MSKSLPALKTPSSRKSLHRQPNVLVRGDELFVIDHEAAFSFLYLIAGKNPTWEVRRRRPLRQHVFFYRLRKQHIDLSLFTARLAALGDDELGRTFERCR